MLAPLAASGLLNLDDLRQYIMALTANFVYCGHHSFDEVAFFVNKVFFPLNPWFDPVRAPIPYYEQLLTTAFISSRVYQDFKRDCQSTGYFFSA